MINIADIDKMIDFCITFKGMYNEFHFVDYNEREKTRLFNTVESKGEDFLLDMEKLILENIEDTAPYKEIENSIRAVLTEQFSTFSEDIYTTYENELLYYIEHHLNEEFYFAYSNIIIKKLLNKVVKKHNYYDLYIFYLFKTANKSF